MDLKAKKNIKQETSLQKKKAEEEKLQQVMARLKLVIHTATWIHLMLLVEHLRLSSGSVCSASDKGTGECDGADKGV